MRVTFERIDLALTVHAIAGNVAEIRVEGREEGGVRFSRVADDLSREIGEALAHLETGDALPTPEPAQQSLLKRITLAISVPELHAEPWEELLQPIARRLGAHRIVRVSPVPARVAERPMAFPMRILIVDDPDPDARVAEIRALLGRTVPDAKAALAVQIGATKLESMHDIAAPCGWPTVDVLHFTRLPASDRSTWIARVSALWQTRLIILDARNDQEHRRARMLGAELVARGGPGVIVRDAAAPARPLYARLIHDFPLDVLDVRDYYFGGDMPDIATLFGGGGREEAARFSNVGEAIVALRGRVRSARRNSGPSGGPRGTPRGPEGDAIRVVESFTKQYGDYAFNMHESEGILPMSAALRKAWSRVQSVTPKLTPKPQPRYVNGSLRHDDRDEVVNPNRERLVVGRRYRLRVAIGERDLKIPVFGDTRLFEDQFAWTPDMKGVFVEVAVSGVGFAIEGGTRVQELWLPRVGPAGPLFFAVRPTRAGTAVLRYTIYYHQNIVQSFRIAALTTEGETKRPRVAKPERDALAKALNIPVDAVEATTWIARLEYDSEALESVTEMPKRTVSLVANHVGDERVITVKGKNLFVDSEAGDVAPLVSALRTAMFDASVRKINEFREDWPYMFSTNIATNEAELQRALPLLALAGWELYDRILPREARDILEQAEFLGGVDAKIAVAHTLLEDVIPWAALYDRMFANDAPTQTCLAALPKSAGALPVTSCGTAADCVLKRDGADPTYVACPLRFWGFRHVIEIPPKQVPAQVNGDGKTAKAPPPAAKSAVTRPRLVAVLNAALHRITPHVGELQKLQNRAKVLVQWSVEQNPASILAALEDEDLDIAYLYCHARGGMDDPATTKPCVEFSDPATKVTRQYAANRFDAKAWKNKPLVFINGCSSAAFSPDALAPFVRKFSRDRKAGGVIGSEIPVHEELAGEVASRFLARFLGGEEAGTALLAVRRSLLADRNPLGLVYTLYAFAELTITDE